MATAGALHSTAACVYTSAVSRVCRRSTCTAVQ
jgi:hypothetical protein